MDVVERDIADAPTDGTIVMGKLDKFSFYWPTPVRFFEGRWCAEFGEDNWRPVSPAPTRWTMLTAALKEGKE